MDNSCCGVEAIVSIDERGQIVIPKDLRKRFDLNPGDKLALISCQTSGEDCCMTLIKTNKMQKMVKSILGPFFKDILNES